MNEKNRLHGIPNEWLVFAQIFIFILTLIFIIKSFFDVNKHKKNDYFKFNILKFKLLNTISRKRWLQFIFQIIPVLLLILIIATGLFGVQNGRKNISTVLTWTIWWTFLIFDIVIMGRMWCMICPWYALSS